MQPSPQPHPQPKTLDHLIANAEHYANFCMRNSGRVTPALFFLGPDGQGMFSPESLADDSAKDDFANNARLVCIAHGATAAVMAMEVWAKFATSGEKLDETERPSAGGNKSSCPSSGAATASFSALANPKTPARTK